MNIYVYNSKNIEDYKIIIRELYNDFGINFCHTILTYCDFIEDPDKDKNMLWNIHILKTYKETINPLEDESIGICGLYSLDSKTENLWLGWFGILPNFRNLNLGTRALLFLKIQAKSLNCKNLYCYVDKSNESALRFYKRNNFHIISSVKEFTKNNNISMDYFENPEDLVIKLNLNS